MRLQNRVAIVTGAGMGIGQSTALLFGEEGAKVVAADIDLASAEKTTAAIRAKGGEAIAVEADIAKEADARRIAGEAVRAFGGIQVLVNNAAAFVLKGFDATFEDWERSLHTNVIGTAMVTKYAVEPMKKTGGAVVNLASMSGWIAQPNFFAYSSTKAAILQMSRNMAMDLAPFKIRVNAVCPGTILTSASTRHMQQAKLTLEEFDRQEGAKTLLGRIGQPREVAQAILFLASSESSYITGTHLMVDGGYTAM